MNTPSRANADRRHPESIQHRVMKSVSEYNRQLNQERKEDRRVCMDLQTYTIQYPVGLGTQNKSLRHWVKRRRPQWRAGRRYPVALLPTQYQDWFMRYSSQELKYFPLNTVLHGPTHTSEQVDKWPSLIEVTNGNGNNSDSEIDGSDILSDLDDDSSCSCDEEKCSPAMKTANEDGEQLFSQQLCVEQGRIQNHDENSCPPNLFSINTTSNSKSSKLAANKGQLNQSMPNLSTINGSNSQQQQQPSCKVCKYEVVSVEDALKCADCDSMSHPACLDFSGELLQAIRLYKWQCQDCKSCAQCGQPHDEDRMMFCDKCDRGYHTYCVGLSTIPEGHWVCALCAVCASCGTKKASENSLSVQWQHEVIKIHSPDGQPLVRHQVFCESCYQLRNL